MLATDDDATTATTLTTTESKMIEEMSDMIAHSLANCLAGAIKTVHPIYCDNGYNWTPLVEANPGIEQQIAKKLASEISIHQLDDTLVILEATRKILQQFQDEARQTANRLASEQVHSRLKGLVPERRPPPPPPKRLVDLD